MYLPKTVIQKLLKKAGYAATPIYVSCEYHASKGTKELYELVLKKEGIKKNRWVHIGDNKYSEDESIINIKK